MDRTHLYTGQLLSHTIMNETRWQVRGLTPDTVSAPEYDALFPAPAEREFFRSRAWFENFCAKGVLAGDRLRLFAVAATADAHSLAIVPATYTRLLGAYPRARVFHFHYPSELLYCPLLGRADADPAVMLGAVVDHLLAARPSFDVLRIGPLDGAAPATGRLLQMLRDRRLARRVFPYFVESYVRREDHTFEQFIAARPQALRDTLQWASQSLLGSDEFSLRLVCAPGEVAMGWEHYMAIMDANEADPEPEPAAYLYGLMRAAAEAGTLRLGLLYYKEEPVAVQVWIVSAGMARCLRIWSVWRYRGQAMFDDMLTAYLARQLIDVDHVDELAFGGVLNEFTERWGLAQRLRIGVSAFNPRTWRGVRNALRQIGAQVLKSAFARLRGHPLPKLVQ